MTVPSDRPGKDARLVLSGRPYAGDRGPETGDRSLKPGERGVALIIALLAMMLLSALGMTLAVTTSTETRIAAAYGAGVEAFYGVDAAVERAVHDLSLVADWNQVLTGALTSSFVDGPAGRRALPNGSQLDLVEATARVNCGKATCSLTDLNATTVDRPWGANNPRWQLYSHGDLERLSPSGTINSSVYIVVWVGDDALENDGQPLFDGDATGGANPGAGVLQLMAHAYGPAGSRRVVEATLGRADQRTRVLSWREMRQ